MNPEVIIVQDKITHYRVPFFQQLRSLLSENRVTLRILYAPEDERWPYDPESGLYVSLDWAEPFHKRYLVGGATWYPVLHELRSADLVIVEAASKRLLNYALVAWQSIGGPRVALWGHGWSHSPRNGVRSLEKLKIWLGRRTTWYFAYTRSVKEGLVDRGYDADRITDVQNAVPARQSRPHGSDTNEIRLELGIPADAIVALYCSRMYPAKRIDFMITAAELARASVPNLELILVGSGPDQGKAQAAAEHHDYIRFLGPLVGEKKTEVYQIAHMVVMPGPVGLGVVDAFQHHVPPVATKCRFHGPEAAYLLDDENGLIADDTPVALAAAMTRLARDNRLHERLVQGCRTSASGITIDEMARRFADGVLKALSQPRRRGRRAP